jgi:hypothetical protein
VSTRIPLASGAGITRSGIDPFLSGIDDRALASSASARVTDGNPLVLRIPIKDDGTAGDPVALPSGFSAFDGIELDAKGNIYVSEILLNQIWVLSPDGSQRLLIAGKQNAPLDNNTSLALRGDVLCTSNLGFSHERPEEADRTVVCMKGFQVPK